MHARAMRLEASADLLDEITRQLEAQTAPVLEELGRPCSFEHLERYARTPEARHLPQPRRRFQGGAEEAATVTFTR